MGKILKWGLVGIGLCVVLAAIVFYMVISSLGGFTKIETTYAGTCERILGMPGAEDIEADYASSMAYVSSDDRWASAAGTPKAGRIYALNMAVGADMVPVAMTGTEALESFHPHGISFLNYEGQKHLFVISHNVPGDPTGGHKVFVFQIEGTHLELLHTLEDTGLRSPNDLAAVGPRQFYFTNDRRAMDANGQLIEMLFALEHSNVAFFDGSKATIVGPDIAFANGIAVSNSGAQLYATSTRSAEVIVYDRDPVSHAVTEVDRIAVGTGPDNISVSPDGRLLIADHPNGVDFQTHAGDPEALSPVRIFDVAVTENQVTRIYEDNGGLLSGVSVAVPFGDRLLMGAVFADGVLVCE